MTDMMSIGISSLSAFKTALAITSENIANANSPYYSRRAVELVEGLFNSGVNVADVRRVFDEQSNRYAQSCTSQFSQWESYFQQLQNIEPLFDDNTTGIGKYINDSLNALQQLSGDPSSMQNRSMYLNKLMDLASRFQNVNSEIERQKLNVNQSMMSQTSDVNQLLAKIAELNDKIANSSGVDQSGISDEREKSLQELAKYFDFNVTTDQNGMVSVNLRNGFSIVSGNKAFEMTTINDPGNSANLMLAVKIAGAVMPIPGLIQSGKLAALANFKANALDEAQRGIGRLVLAIQSSLNKQNKLGIDANANLGTNIFNDINNTVAINGRVTPNLQNTGTGNLTVNINDVTKLTTSDYKLVVGAGNTYTITRLSDNVPVSSGVISATLPQTIAIDGFDITLNTGSTFSANDQYLISPTKNATNNMALNFTDPAKLALGWPVNGVADAKNTGKGKIQVDDILDTTSSMFSIPKALNPPIRIEFITATTYRLVDANTSTVIEGPITYNPLTGASIFPTPLGYDPKIKVSLSGDMQPGDKFDLQYNTNPSTDNHNKVALTKLYETGILQDKTVSFTQGYQLVSNDISMKTNLAKSKYQSSEVIKNAADKQRTEISGVQLEEETMNLVRYQQAYQASAQILQTAKSVFEMIMSLTK